MPALAGGTCPALAGSPAQTRDSAGSRLAEAAGRGWASELIALMMHQVIFR